MSAIFELVPVSDASTASRKTIVWDRDIGASGIDASVNAWLSEFGHVSDAAIALARVCVGVFIADRGTRRNSLRQTRQIELHTRVPDPVIANDASDELERWFGFLTGDEWKLRFEPDVGDRPASEDSRTGDIVALLSGGLDSYCAALIGGSADHLFLSHSDSPVITHSQSEAIDHIPGFDPTKHVRVRIAAKEPYNVEGSRRSRSALFMGLAVALADASGIDAVEVPENGFTSLNPPLAANRAGVLATRSTHPMTFALAEQALGALGIMVELRNPYEWHTKGELVAAAAGHVGASQRGPAKRAEAARLRQPCEVGR